MGRFGIAAPFTSAKEVKSLSDAGASELYCGFIDSESERFWPASFLTINRRGRSKSFEDFEVFRSSVAEARRYSLPVYVTMNSFYTPEQYPWLLKTVRKIENLDGIRGLIVSDIAFLITLRKTGFRKDISISTLGTIFNSSTADFYYRMGSNRVVLDRQMGLREIMEVISRKRTPVGIEIFAFDSSCLFIDGYCMFCHYNDRAYDEPPAITKKGHGYSFVERSYNTSIKPCGCMDVMDEIVKVRGRPLRPGAYSIKCCNLCHLYDLRDQSRITIKITERGEDQSETVRMIRSLVKSLFDNKTARNDFIKMAKNTYYVITGRVCSASNCPSMFYR